MASYQNPQVTNPILDDVNTIRELAKYNAKLDPSLGEGLEAGMIRLATVSGGKQFQMWNGSSWTKLGKLVNDADTLDGKHASTSAVKDTIPVYNSNDRLVGSITGNAATATKLETVRTIDLGGQVVSTATSFDGSNNITIPITQLLVNNETDTAVKGTLTPLHGGTGRTDGASLDVAIQWDEETTILASDYGQIGRAKQITSSTDFNTLVIDGNYTGYATVTVADNNAPDNYTKISIHVRVSTLGNTILQIMTIGGVIQWSRSSVTGGASWGGWTPIGGTKPTVTIYVSQSGSDNNTGYDSAYPVATITKAIQIAKGAIPRGINGSVKLCIGGGNWGNISISPHPFSIHIYPFSGSAPTEYSIELPVFGEIQVNGSGATVTLSGIVADSVSAGYNGYCTIQTGYKKIGRLLARYNGFINVLSNSSATNVLEIFNTGSTDPIWWVHHGGFICIQQYLHVLVSENIANSFMSIGPNSKIMVYDGELIFDETDAVVSGKKFYIGAGGYFTSYNGGSNTLPTFLTSTLPGTGYTIEKGAIINGIPYGTAWDDDVLHLSGGTMGDTAIIKTKKTDRGAILRWDDGTNFGGGLWLYSSQDSSMKGGFLLQAVASDNVTRKNLVGYSDGILTWDGKNIVRSYNGTTADTAGNVAYTGSQRHGTDNFVPTAGDTVAGWEASQNNKTEVYWYYSKVLSNQPNQYGHLISTVHGQEIAQIFVCAPNGQIYTRGGNSSGGWNGSGETTASWIPAGLPNSFSAATYGATNNGTLTHGGTFTVPYVTRDTYGRVTGGGTRTLTMPGAQTTISGNAASATKLQTYRNIKTSVSYSGGRSHIKSISGSGNANFNGTSNISINMPLSISYNCDCSSGDSCFIVGEFTVSEYGDRARVQDIKIGDCIYDIYGLPHKVIYRNSARVPYNKKAVKIGNSVFTDDHIIMHSGESCVVNMDASYMYNDIHDYYGNVVGSYVEKPTRTYSGEFTYIDSTHLVEHIIVVENSNGSPVWADFSGVTVQLAVGR